MVRGIFFLAVVPFLYPSVFPSFSAPAVQFVSGALLLVPLGSAIEAAMEYIIHRLYLFHRRLGIYQSRFTTHELLDEYAKTRSRFIGGFIHSFVGNLAFLALTASVLISAASAAPEARQELVTVVQTSIAGNLVVNILFVLGVATIVGGLRHKGIAYDPDIANAYAEMLTLAVIALGLPTLAYKLNLSVGFTGPVFHISSTEAARLSDITAIALIAIFVGFFLYTVVGFRSSELTEDVLSQRRAGAFTRRANAPVRAEPRPSPAATQSPSLPGRSPLAHLSLLVAIVGVVAAGAGIVLISERMAETLEVGLREGFLPGVTLNPFFVGFILLPLSSHIAEVFAATSMSTHVELEERENPNGGEPHLETCHGITIGSSIQVALLVAPALVLVGHLAGLAQMNLIFSPFILAIFGLMVYLLQVNVFDGKTDWLEGMEMIAFYALLTCVAFLAGT